MQTQEKMNRYISRTRISGRKFERYSLKASEITVLYELVQDAKAYEALILAFMYGASKGYHFAEKKVNQNVQRGM